MDWLNAERQRCEDVIRQYEQRLVGSSSRPVAAAARDARVQEQLSSVRHELQQTQRERDRLQQRVDAAEVEAFTAQEEALRREEQHRQQTAALSSSLAQQTAAAEEGEKQLSSLHLELAAQRRHWEERLQQEQAEWGRKQGVREMADKIESLTRLRREAEEEREALRLRHEELKAELTLLQGRYEEDVLSLRQAAVAAEEQRRQQEQQDEQQRKRVSSLSLSQQQLQADLALSAKQLQHAQTELSWYRDKLREAETRGRQETEDELRQQAAMRMRAEEAEGLRVEAERLKAERLRLLDESQSLSLLVHQLQQDGKEKEERLHQLRVELQLAQQVETRRREAEEQAGQQAGGWGRDEAERIIARQRQQLELLKRELDAAYDSLRSVRKEKGDMYEMLRVCDLQLVRVQLAVKQMEDEKEDGRRELQQQQEAGRRGEEALERERQDRQRLEEERELLKRERDESEFALKEAQHRLSLLQQTLDDSERETGRVRAEKERRERETELVLKREADATSRYWEKERELREAKSRLQQLETAVQSREREEAQWKEERERLLRRVEEVETVVKHMDALSFARTRRCARA